MQNEHTDETKVQIPFTEEDKPVAWEISVSEHALFVDQWCWQCVPVYTDGRPGVAWLGGCGQSSAEEARHTGEMELRARGLAYSVAHTPYLHIEGSGATTSQ